MRLRAVPLALAATLSVVACSPSDQGEQPAPPEGAGETAGERAPQDRPTTPPAEPGNAPQPTAEPAGRVVALPEGGQPWGVAYDPASRQVFTALREPARLATYDLADDDVRVTPTPGAARMIDLVAPGGPLLYPAETLDTLYTIAVPSLEIEQEAPAGRGPHQAVQVGDTTFVTEEFGHAVRALRGGETVARFTEPVQPGGLTATDGRVAVVDVVTNTLFVYDAATGELVTSLPAGEGPSHVVPVGDGKVAVCDVRGNAVLTYDITGEPRELDRISVPGRAFWIEADAETGTVYAALSNTNRVAQLDVGQNGSLTERSTVPTVQEPVSMDLDPNTGTVYVAGYAQSELQIVPPTAFGD